MAPGLLVAERRSTGPVAGPVDGLGADAVIGAALVRADEGYLASLYVDPTHQGTGAGRLLLSRCARLCLAVDNAYMRWWVFETNADARRAYASWGAIPTGRHRVEPEYGITELELTLSL